jgi:transcriptional regulator with XRE-family HTH domain
MFRHTMASYSVQHPITKWRTSRKPALTSAEVADKAGVDRTSLSKVEHGVRDRLGAASCLRLVRAFPDEISLEELLSWSWRKLPSRRGPQARSRRRSPRRTS